MRKTYAFLLLFVLIILSGGLSAQAPYCTPDYSVGCQNGDGLTSFQLGSIYQEIQCDGTPNPWYQFYGDTTELMIGGNHTLTVYTAVDSTVVYVWIDFNNDNYFDFAEQVISGMVCFAVNANITTDLIVPANAPAGLHRMRFRTERSNYFNPFYMNGYPCLTYQYGNAGDFTVNLVAPAAPGPAALNSPADGATGILPTTSLNWTPGPGFPPAGYHLYLGTDNPPTNILNGALVSIPYFNPYPDLATNTTYYWKVVPYNSGGSATSNTVWSFTTLGAYGSLQGYVTNSTGIAVNGATVTASGPSNYNTTTDVAGHYILTDVEPGTYTLSGQAATYNTSTLSGIEINPGAATSQALVLLQPNMTVLPNPNNATLNPGEVLSNNFSIINTGNGTLGWSASIAYGNSNTSWFSMPTTSGSVNASTNASAPAVFNAGGIAAGTILNATVTYVSTPNVGTVAVPVTMTVAGAVLSPATNTQCIMTNALTGAVNLSWDCIPSAGFLYYNVKRNGVHLANVASNTYYPDYLPAFGTYTYCVEAVYSAGTTSQSCADVEWANPQMIWSPATLAATVWSNTQKTVPFTISNAGIGMLAYEFPDYTDHPGDNLLAYCTASANQQDEFISRVQLNTIDYSSGWLSYSNYTSVTTELVREMTYPITVTLGPPSYTGDITGVWIDYDHNSIFDAGEFISLTGSSPATGVISVPATAISGPTTMRIRTQYNGTLSPCGTTPYGEVEDYTVIIHEPTFITQVMPASGFVEAGTTQIIHTTFAATGSFATPGVYTTTLKLSSNDLAHTLVNIPAIMTVGMAATMAGVVVDCTSGEPLNGALVQVGAYSTMTNDTGYYSLQLSAAVYTVLITKLGYQNVAISNVVLIGGNTTAVNAQMCEYIYPPACAYAAIDSADTQCTVTWCPPAGLYEMLYDDATPENYAAWLQAGSMNAVKFTPKGYPATITGARFLIGDGFNGSSSGSTMGAGVYSADASGLPGTLLDSTTISILANGWVEVSGLNATITGGDFFIVMVQYQPQPDCPYLGVDETLPTAYKSYSRNISAGGAWEVSPYQDFMIRAIVNGPVSGDDDHMLSQAAVPVPIKGMISIKPPSADAGFKGLPAMINLPEGGDNMNMAYAYHLSRIFLGSSNPVSPANGLFTLFNNSFTSTTYDDGGTAWAALAQGWYAYGIEAVYPNMQPSGLTYTNAVPHRMFANLTVNVKLDCGLVPAAGAIVKLTGLNYPYDHITDTVPASGTLIFSNSIKGEYILAVHYPGYYSYSASVSLIGNKTVDVVLGLMRFGPRNLYIDDASLVTTWNEPLSIVVKENFESGIYPPAGWQTSSQGMPGWFFTTDGSSAELPVPPHTAYAVANDDLAGAANNGCCDYLITPELNLTGAPSYMLNFQSYFNGNLGQQAYVEMSTDDGATWSTLYTCTPGAASWNQVEIDLSSYSGPTGLQAVKFAFHTDDGGIQASGWAVDDIVISSGGLAVDGFSVMRDGVEVGQTNDLVWYFDPTTFNYGQSYSVCVAAIYCGINSETICDSVTSLYLCPPLNLQVDTLITSSTGAAFLTWDHPLDYCLPNVIGFNIYRNDVILVQLPATDTAYLDVGLPPADFCYDITAIYDITAYGFPGLFAESAKAVPGWVCVDIAYGMGLPFFEDFSGGSFDTTMWDAGANWLIDSNSDNPVPAAKFRWDPLLVNYTSALESHWLSSPALINNMPYRIWFDYDFKLQDQAADTTEKLTIEVWDGSSWIVVKETLNNGSFDWTPCHLEITAQALGHSFKVRFRASGSSSDAIQYWAVDNIHIFSETFFLPPVNLEADATTTPGDNAIQLNWEAPMKSGTLMSYIMDDNTGEGVAYYNTTGECWLGNEFPVTESGVLQSVSVFMQAHGSAIYTIDIFDSARNLAGSSAAFLPIYDDWTTVELPYIGYHGTFYAMVHMVVSTESDYLGLDEDGPYSTANLVWYYEGTVWAHLTDLGFEPGVALIRANGIAEITKSLVTFIPGAKPVSSAPLSVPALEHKKLDFVTGNEVAHATALTAGIGDTLMGYNVYRRAYTAYPPGQNTTGSGVWTKMNPAVVVPTGFTDEGLSNLVTNCYEYLVTAVYVQGESDPSNSAWQAVFVGVTPWAEAELTLYPNPATNYVRIGFTNEAGSLSIYNALGTVMETHEINGKPFIIINTAPYPAGVYTVKFTSAGGYSFSRKFIVVK